MKAATEVKGRKSEVRKTVLTKSTAKAAEFLRCGEVVAFPTETVYGLGADVFDKAAVRKIYEAKGRPSDNPLIAHIASLDQLSLLAKRVTPSAKKMIAKFFPGPLTIVLPKTAAVPPIATAGLQTIGVRMPAHKIAHAFLSACGTPVVAPSANRSGLPSPTRWQAVRDDLDGRIACILQGGATDVGLESTVVDCTGRSPVVLRAGAVTLEMLREIVPATRMHDARNGGVARSPGMKHRHYAPSARVVLVSSAGEVPASAAFIGLHRPAAGTRARPVKICRDLAAYAHGIFDFFRACDAAGIKTIACESVPERGLGVALMDRMRRAAAR